MQHTMIRAAAATQAFITTARERLAREEDGQVSIEWVGILALVGAIIAVILTFNIDDTVRTEVQNAIDGIFGGGGNGGGGGGGGGAQPAGN